MQLKSKDGIACDNCGVTQRQDFVYYSLDLRLVSVFNNRRPPLNNILNTKVARSLDYCEACFDHVKKEVVKHYQQYMVADTRQRGRHMVHICELTGKRMESSQQYDFYYCDVAKVEVKMTGQPSKCSTCGKEALTSDKACIYCGGVSYTKEARVDVSGRLLEINICMDHYNKMVDTAESHSQKPNEWSTSG